MYVCEGESVYSGKRWRSSPNIAKRMQLSIVITETDKIPDVGEGTVTVELRDGYEVSTLVVVEENGGRYKGHKATWEIACRIKEVAVSPRTAKDIFCFSGQNSPYHCPKPRKAPALLHFGLQYKDFCFPTKPRSALKREFLCTRKGKSHR